MFDQLSYVGYTVLFCLPPIILIWLRREFFDVLSKKWRPVLVSTLAITAYGSLIWPVALKYRCWTYEADRFTGVKLLGYVYLDDVFWWLLVSFLFSSFIILSAHYERQGIDIVWREITGLLRSFANAIRGFRIIPRERNSTIHVAAGVFILLEAALFRISREEWMVVLVVIGLVLGLEILNSSIERIASRTIRETGEQAAVEGTPPAALRHEEIGLIKDAAAAAVLISALAAAAVGMTIFLRRITEYLI